MINEQDRLKASREFAQGISDKQREITESEIRQDTSFAEAYKVVNSYLNPDEVEAIETAVPDTKATMTPQEMSGGVSEFKATPTQEEYANKGMQLVSDVKNSIFTADEGLGLVGSYMKFKDAPQDVKDSLWYMWDSYDKADMTWDAFGRGLKSMGKDPSTYTGAGAGIKFFGSKAVQSATTKRLKAMLASGVTGGAFMGGEEIVKQEVQSKQQIDWEKVGEQTIMGTIVGTVLPPVAEGAIKGVVAGSKAIGDTATRWASEGEQEMMKMAGGGTPPVEQFYSQLGNALSETNQQTWNKQQLQGFLAKQGVKTEEMKWSGIQEYLDGMDDKAKISTQDLLNELNQPQLEKKVLGEFPKKETEDTFILDYEDMDDEVLGYLNSLSKEDRKVAETMMKQSNRNLIVDGTFEKEWDMLLSKYPKLDHNIIHDVGDALFDEYHEAYAKADFEPKYRDYTVKDADGTSYREELTTLPVKMDVDSNKFKITREEKINKRSGTTQHNAIVTYDGKNIGKYEGTLSDEEIKKLAVNETKRELGSQYKSSHWDESNVLYHVRKQDVKVDGDNTLLIEEIQSDWHQAGRKSGYKGTQQEIEKAKKASNDYKNMLKEKYGLQDKSPMQLRAYLRDNKLTEERDMLNKLAEEANAVDKALAVPQAPYSKTWHEKAMKDQIAEAVDKGYDRVAWVAGKEQAERYSLSDQVNSVEAIKNKKGKWNLLLDTKRQGERDIYDLSDEELADNIGKEMAQKIITDDGGFYEGKGLEIGGEGMKGFYDKILPKWTDKYIKKFGAKVEVKKLPNGQEVWSFPVTDKMKKDIKGKGQALYSATAGAGAIGATQQKEESK